MKTVFTTITTFFIATITTSYSDCNCNWNIVPPVVSITPQFICAGDQVSISWNGGSLYTGVKITGSRNGEIDQSRSHAGSHTDSPQNTTTYRVVGILSNGNPGAEIMNQLVEVLPPEGSILASFNFGCPGNAYNVTSYQHYSNRVKVTTVVNPFNDRSITVNHNGTAVFMPANTSTNQFTGMPVNGSWSVTVQSIRSFEGCGRNDQVGGATIYHPLPDFILPISYSCGG